MTNSSTLQELIDAQEVISSSNMTAGTNVTVEALEVTYNESTLHVQLS